MICGDENGTNGYQLTVFGIDVALICHFGLPALEVLVVLGTPVKFYLKWRASQLAIYSIVGV